jgi:hypothetical protein
MENLRTDFHIQQSDIRPLILEQLQMLKDNVDNRIGGTSDRYARTHLEYVQMRLEALI